MTNFKEHDGVLFKMLDKPVPLTPDAKMPVLVRLIQDDSPMGRYNQSYSEYRYGVRLGCCMLPIIATHIAKNGVVNDIEWDVSRYEIIGTFVKEGSADWAFGWQICEKPKEEPQPAKEPIANCKNCKHLCTNSNIDHCHMYEPCGAPSPKSATQTSLPVSDATQLKVGDWVEIESSHTKGKTFVSMIKEMPNQEHRTVHVNSFRGCEYYGVMERQIIRKLKPSQVIVRIGCLSGTIAKSSDPNYFLMLHSRPITDCNHSIIRFSAIDTDTRSLVESLLKAQEEENAY